MHSIKCCWYFTSLLSQYNLSCLFPNVVSPSPCPSSTNLCHLCSCLCAVCVLATRKLHRLPACVCACALSSALKCLCVRATEIATANKQCDLNFCCFFFCILCILALNATAAPPAVPCTQHPSSHTPYSPYSHFPFPLSFSVSTPLCPLSYANFAQHILYLYAADNSSSGQQSSKLQPS